MLPMVVEKRAIVLREIERRMDVSDGSRGSLCKADRIGAGPRGGEVYK